VKIQVVANKIIIGVALLIALMGATGFYVSYSQESSGLSAGPSSSAVSVPESDVPVSVSSTISQMLQDETVPRSLSLAEPIVGPVSSPAIATPAASNLSAVSQAAQGFASQTLPAVVPTVQADQAQAVAAAKPTVVTPEMEAAEITAQALPSDILMPSVGAVTEPMGTGVVNGSMPRALPVGPAAAVPAQETASGTALQERQGPTLEQLVTQAAQEAPEPVLVPVLAGAPGAQTTESGSQSNIVSGVGPSQEQERVYGPVSSPIYSIEQQEVAPGVVDITQELPTPSIESDEMVFDEKAKRATVEQLVKQGVDYFNTHSMAQTCHAFTHTKEFMRGELYLFLFSYDGTTFAHGQQKDLLWKNLYDLRDSFGTPVVQTIINGAKRGGGWVTYSWRNATKISYVQEVKKDGKFYAIGTGYYPHSKVDAVVTMVKGAVAFFNQTMKSGKRVEDAFSPLSYPIGRFVYGDLYLYALDFKGTNLAHGARPGLIGTNSWNYKDAQGRLVNQEIIQQLKMTDKGVWIEYLSGGASKRAYAEKVTDTQGNHYFIACGYYIDAGRNEVVDLVRKGYQFMKIHGISAASEEFSDVRRSDYRHGDLYLVVYDTNGKIIAHGANPEFIGRNHYDDKDESGRHYVREFIQKGRDGGGWVDIKMKNSFQSVYVEKVELGIDSFIVTCGVYPVSKYETMELLAKSGVDYLEMGTPKDVFAEFVDKDGKFVRGDLSLFVFDSDGICYTYGDDNSLIWHNLLNVTDDKGVTFVQQFINTVKQGANMVRYTLNGVEKIGYISSVQKDGKVYVVGSSYYR
jgi:signal transduction histidine kinase